MLSDANLAMYGVSPKSLATALMSDPMVNSYAIFIAGEAAAEALKQEMPVGHARACSCACCIQHRFLLAFFLANVVVINANSTESLITGAWCRCGTGHTRATADIQRHL